MSVLPSDIVTYGSANMPEAEGSTVGGAVDFTRRIAFYDLSAAGAVDVISSSASDTATKIAYYGRDVSGVIQTETLTLSGRAWVTGSLTLERLLYAALSGASANGPITNPGGTAAVGDVALAAHGCILPPGSVTTDATVRTAQAGSVNATGATPALFKLQAGDGALVTIGQVIWTKSGTAANQLRQIIATAGYGTDVVAVSRDWSPVPDGTTTYKILQGMLFEISPNKVTSITRAFATSAADAAGGMARTFYEKVFVVNNNAASALTGAQIEIAGETPTLPSGALLDIALCTGLNDAATSANRQTAPVSGAGPFVTQPAFVNVPGAGNLPPGAAPNAAGAQGLWLRLTLPAGAAAYKGSADLRTQGTTT
jgi:hypothetical protein